jgi:hypothetical protein
MVMYWVAELLFAFSVMLPTKVWPARSRMTSPGAASLMAV